MFALDRPEIANAAADVGADLLSNLVSDLQPAVVDCFLRSSNRIMNESAHLARFFLLDIVQRIKVFDFAGESNRESFGVKFFDVIRATAALSERGPSRLD